MSRLLQNVLLLSLLLFSSGVLARDYFLPADINSGAFDDAECSGGGPTYNCNGNLELDDDDTVTLTGDVTLNINGNVEIGDDVVIDDGGNTLTLNVNGNFEVGEDSSIDANIDVDGNVEIDDDGQIRAWGEPEQDRY